MRISVLIFKNYLRQITIKEYLIMALIHVPLSVVILVMVFAEKQDTFINVFLNKYPYLFASQSFISGLLSWDIEIYAGIYPYMHAKPHKLVLSRTLYFVMRMLPITFFSILLFIIFGENLYGVVHILLLMVVMGLLGIGFALSYGFNSEKSLNNINHLSIWILSLTPGIAIPVNSGLSPYLSLIFPQNVSSVDEFMIELLKLASYLTLAVFLIYKGCQPSGRMYFRK
ncbi:hypothetical protein Xmau_01464 [Xenorhabdus mauleonii]|uniref:Uncharacterized protein n=1 Tax=Xenorhabdus mauleonii TaxID=351675 RepID=A0A1I3PMI3_9GAMM|nr:hypothetical protein [Xenorhabdus mauleonii]PHM44751.1 hypothetical protein Xmau_01464 [Xenorhabdus mauleonii]SFJ22693.1 hypothetical protein SAMN05421680_106197 [Xenorhabdus mauleonii]